MSAKFNGTWVRIEKLGIVRVDSFEGDAVFVVPLRDEGRWINSSEFIIKQEYPQVGVMINYRKKALRISRTPLRQWRVGLFRSTLRLSCGEVEVPVAQLTTDFVETLYNPKYLDVKKAVDLLNADSSSSYAISEYYWIRRHADGKGVELMRRDISVGLLEEESKDSYIVRMFGCSSSLSQEIEDEFKHGKYKVRASV